jgi:hypothetical protein
LLLALGALLTACGTTVPTSARGQAAAAPLAGGSTNAGLGAAAPAAAGLSPVGTAGSSGGQSAPMAGSAATGSARTSTGTAAAPASLSDGSVGSGTGGAAGSNGPGITATTISIGILYATNGDAYEAALGNTAATQGDVGSEYRYIVKDLNDHGGIAGRKVVPVYHSVDATSGQSTEQTEQATCADFTQDHKVFAMVPGGTQNILACMSKAGAVVAESGGLTGQTTAEYNQFPANFDATSISLDRLVANLVPVLQRAKYFTPWDTAAGAPGQLKPVTGIVVPDRPEYHHAVDVLVRALSRIGIVVSSKDIVFYHWPNSSAEDGQAVTEIQSAVLKFKTDGVTHVIPLEVNGQVFFAAQADKQQYRPRYGINSASGDQAYLGSLIPSSQLHGAIGLGYFPAVDLPASMNPDNGPYSGPARRHCLDVMKKNGVTFSDTNAEAVALSLCDGLYELKAVLEHIDPAAGLNQRSVAASIDSIGSVPSATYVTVAYGPHRRDAVSNGYLYAYFADCDCMHYTGPRFSLT